MSGEQGEACRRNPKRSFDPPPPLPFHTPVHSSPLCPKGVTKTFIFDMEEGKEKSPFWTLCGKMVRDKIWLSLPSFLPLPSGIHENTSPPPPSALLLLNRSSAQTAHISSGQRRPRVKLRNLSSCVSSGTVIFRYPFSSYHFPGPFLSFPLSAEKRDLKGRRAENTLGLLVVLWLCPFPQLLRG